MPQAFLTYPPSSSPHSRTVAARPLASAVSLLTAPSAADHLSWRTSHTDLLYTPSPPASSPTHLILSREVAHSKQLKLLLFYTTILLLVHPSFQPLHHLVIPQFHCPYIRLAGCFSTTTSFLLELQLSITLSHIKRIIFILLYCIAASESAQTVVSQHITLLFIALAHSFIIHTFQEQSSNCNHDGKQHSFFNCYN